MNCGCSDKPNTKCQELILKCCEDNSRRVVIEAVGLLEGFFCEEASPTTDIQSSIEVLFEDGYEDEELVFTVHNKEILCQYLDPEQDLSGVISEGKAALVSRKQKIEISLLVASNSTILKVDRTSDVLPKDTIEAFKELYTPWDVLVKRIEGVGVSTHCLKEVWVKPFETEMIIEQANSITKLKHTEVLNPDGTISETPEESLMRFNAEVKATLINGRFPTSKVPEVGDVVIATDHIEFEMPQEDFFKTRGIEPPYETVPLGVFIDMPRGYELRSRIKGEFLTHDPHTKEILFRTDSGPPKTIAAMVSPIEYDQNWLHHTDHSEAKRLAAIPEEDINREGLFAPIMLCKPGEFRTNKDGDRTEELKLFHSLNTIGKTAYLMVHSNDFKKDLEDFIKPHLIALELHLEKKDSNS